MQTVVIALSTTMAVTATILGGSLLVASDDPFDDAFTRYHGAHLSAQFDGSAVSAAELSASSGAVDGVSATAGPFPMVSVVPTVELPASEEPLGGPNTGPPGTTSPITVVGRGDPDGEVDDLALTEGEWATEPDEIVVAADRPEPLGTTLTFADVPGSPTLTVVGKARSATRTADAWATPSAVEALTTPEADLAYQMLYRFADADTAADVAAGRDAVTSAVGAEAMTGSQSWLAVREDLTRETALFVPFLGAFGLIGLLMSVLIVGNVIASAVGSGARRIGILKALGFTPSQVVRGYVVQALVPAVVGTVLGVVAGNLLAVPILDQTETAYAASGLTVAWWVNVAASAGILVVVAATALAAAWRAGRLRTVDALAVGRTPTAGRGLGASRLAARLPVPRPLSLGLVRPFARPARAVAMVASVAFGATAITFTVGLSSSLSEVLAATANDSADVRIQPMMMPQGPGAESGGGPRETADHGAVAAVIEDQPETAAYYSTARTEVTVSGMTGAVAVEAFTGDASWGGYEMISGRWIEGAGEVVLPTPLLAASGSAVGDTITLNHEGVAIPVRIVGEVFDTTDGGKTVFTDAATFADAGRPVTPFDYHVALTGGADVGAYIDAVTAEVEPLGFAALPGSEEQESSVTATLNALAAMLSLLLVTVAVLGVLNGVLLDIRDRVRELGIHKALGMAPRQTIALVLASVALPGVVGAAIGVLLGYVLHAVVMPAIGDSAGLRLPQVVTDVYGPGLLVLLGVAGVLVAIAGSLPPAGWAARTRTATALRTE
ncbi:ABC transporter permease [Jiangella aurantiaca]|uniref:ABC transporter permease n=1 Tax=Jiangella aurantiaca TaxID=2530373 RepID=A0A4R5AE06_9ACTN|nr:ABC transporter permease [Jiangella aurantiaca]